MREEVRKGGDEMKVEFSRHKLANFKVFFSCSPPRCHAIGEMALFHSHQSKGGVAIKGILVAT